MVPSRWNVCPLNSSSGWMGAAFVQKALNQTTSGVLLWLHLFRVIVLLKSEPYQFQTCAKLTSLLRVSLYLSPAIFPSPCPFKNVPKSFLPPPCFTTGMVFSAWSGGKLAWHGVVLDGLKVDHSNFFQKKKPKQPTFFIGNLFVATLP